MIRRILIVLLGITLLYQGVAFALPGVALCGGQSSSMSADAAMHAMAHTCCADQPGDTGPGAATGADCGSMSGCSVPVVAFLDHPLPGLQSCTDSPVTLEPSFRSVEIRDVWRPPLAI